MDQPRQNSENRVERTGVTAQKTADDADPPGSAASLGHHQRQLAGDHAAEEVHRRLLAALVAHPRRARQGVGIAMRNDQDIASVELHRRLVKQRTPTRSPGDDVVGD